MNGNLEETILSLARQRGLLREEDVGQLTAESTRTGVPRLELLEEQGLISVVDLGALKSEAAASLASHATRPLAPTTALRSAFPVKDWDRYEFQAYLGAGAMGMVYKALDKRLKRPVALKFILGNDPELIERFQHEARAQASVDHENICKVYEVGEVDGRPYIAMQFIDGQPLHHVAGQMTLDQKALVMKQAAEAIHEAHRIGLIHRDIKPSNILVTRTEDGRWKPFVMDFGLAREGAAPGLTMTGAVLGTPSFMSPEQARGEVHVLDRRTDVYGLGATLYALLTDRAPFEGEAMTTVLQKVLQDVPDSPRAARPDLPADLESITMKCLRKKPSERYGSARELAEDLQRYLDGEPILARPTTTWHRMKMKAAKHKVAVRVGAVLLPLLLIALTWGSYSWWTASQRERMAREFGEEVQQIEAIARYSALAPLHDIRPDRERIRAKMTDIEQRMRRAGRAARGAGHYALGRGDLALRDFAEAREHLQDAWDEGYREPQVAYALGLALGELYQDELVAVAGMPQGEARDEAAAAVRKEYAEPAVEHLQEAEGVETESPEFLAGLMAFYEDRWEDALERTEDALRDRAWLFEAKRLQGDVYGAMAYEALQRGESDEAARLYDEARSTFEAAAGIAPSDPDVYKHLAENERLRMMLEITDRGLDVEPPFRRGLAAVDSALVADADDPEGWGVRAGLYGRLAEYRINRREDAGQELEQAVAAAERALALDPSFAEGYRQLGAAYRHIGRSLQGRGEDPRPAFEKSIRAWEEAARLDPRQVFHRSVGLLFSSIAQYQVGVGEDPRENLTKAIASLEKAIAAEPGILSSHHGLGMALFNLAGWETDHGTDSSLLFDRAVEAFRGALEINPDHPIVLQSLALTQNSCAEYAMKRGVDPTERAEMALAALTRAIERNPESAYLCYFHDCRGIAWILKAKQARLHGEDCTEPARRAAEELESAIAANAGYFHAPANLSSLECFLADHALETGRDPEPDVARAIGHADDALAINPAHFFAYHYRADALRVRAEHRLESGRDPSGAIAEGIRTVERGLEVNSRSADLFGCRGRLLVLQGRWQARSGADPIASWTEAAAAFDRAIEVTPDEPWFQVRRANLLRRRAEWHLRSGGSAEQDITAGLAAADRAREINEHLAEAGAVRAALLVLRAETLEAGPARDAALGQARKTLETALATNGHLARRYTDVARRIEELSRGAGGDA